MRWTLEKCRFWLVGLALFFGLAAAAGAIPASLPLRTSAYDTALLCFFGMLLAIHAGTVYYASLRPGELASVLVAENPGRRGQGISEA
jgi:hypothetical protein